MKWNHRFTLTKNADTYRIYNSEDNEVRLDFFSHGLRVAIYKKDSYLFPTFSICPGESSLPYDGRSRLDVDGLDLISQKDEIIIDDIKVNEDLDNLKISYYKDDKLLFADRDILAYNFEGELGKGSYHYLTREENEIILGLGDKTGNINKAGRCYKMETFDSMGFDANSSDPLYKQVPFYICINSVGSYGLFYDTYSNGEMNFGEEINNYYPPYKYAHFEEDVLVYYVLFGNQAEILSRFSYLIGKPSMPPKWSFKYCASTMTYTDAIDTDKRLYGFLDLIKKYNIDCGGFYLSSGYTQIGDKRYVFNWNKDKIPNPKKLADEFREAGIHFLPNVKPAFLTDHPLYEEIAKKGWFLHYKDGTPAIFPFWGGYASYFDFTNKDAAAFWTECVKKNLVDLGYEAIWNDNNEYDIHDDEVYANGFGHEIKAKLIRPLFSFLMARASRAAQDGNYIMNVSRSGIAGSERICQTWTGDNKTSFADFRANHKMAMTLALSGYHLFGQDIGGFSGPKPDEELFIRWIQYGIFTPRFTLHSWKSDGSVTMPWLYEEKIPLVQKLFDLRKRLVPYLYNEAIKSINEYKPLIYPLFLKYKDMDIESDSFMYGDCILSCPVFDKGKEEIEVDLPKEDKWYYQDQIYSGKVVMKAPLDDLPVYFIKAGSVIPAEEDGIVFHIYPLDDGKYCYTYYEEDKKRVISVTCTETEIKINGVEINKIVIHDSYSRNVNIC